MHLPEDLSLAQLEERKRKSATNPGSGARGELQAQPSGSKTPPCDRGLHSSRGGKEFMVDTLDPSAMAKARIGLL